MYKAPDIILNHIVPEFGSIHLKFSDVFSIEDRLDCVTIAISDITVFESDSHRLGFPTLN